MAAMAREDDSQDWWEEAWWVIQDEDISKEINESTDENGERTAHVMVAFLNESSGKGWQYQVDFDDLMTLYTSPREIFKACGVD